jgi:hypothetical protein
MRSLIRALGVAAVLVLLAVACGDDSGDTADTTEAPATTEAAEAVDPESVVTVFDFRSSLCQAEAVEAFLDPDVVLTIEFEGEETVFTGSAEVLAWFEGNWENGCPEAAEDFEIISVEGNTVTTESTSTLPDGTKVRPTSVYEVSDDGSITSIRFIEGPVVDDG